MAAKDELTARLEDLRDLRRLMWVTVGASAGGTVGLLIGELTVIRLFFAVIGALISVAGIGSIRYWQRQIREIVDRLKEL
ncbi:MAG: hypothetical protein ACRERD_14910 [Candidatus Binatia bacterium]